MVNRDRSAPGGYYAEALLSGAPRYCEVCGTRLEMTEEQRGWNQFYGVPDYRERKVCPYRRGFFSRHTDTGWMDLVYIPPRPKAVIPP